MLLMTTIIFFACLTLYQTTGFGGFYEHSKTVNIMAEIIYICLPDILLA